MDMTMLDDFFFFFFKLGNRGIALLRRRFTSWDG